MNPPTDLFDRVERLLGSRPLDAIYRPAGFSIAGRWSIDLADGRRVFAKLATHDHIARRTRDEHRNMIEISEDLRCRVLAWEDGEQPLLVVEDLSHGRWPPPWGPGDVERVREALDELADQPVPSNFPSGEIYRGEFSGWRKVADDPEPFVSLRLASREWLDDALPRLLEAEQALVLEGEDLVHFDVRGENLCFLEDRVVFVDWNFAARSRRQMDYGFWLPSLRLEGGPFPEEVLPDAADVAVAASGMFAAYAGLPPPPTAPTVRPFQLRQLRISLPWACRELGLPQPDVLYAREEIPRIDRSFEVGEITETEWHARVEEVLIDAYLATDDPRAGSGKGGDEAEWRWARELILDVFPKKATFLDVGCANGYLMESVHRWGAERGIEVEPYGLDISWRIVSLARFRLPQWLDRIFVGNAIDWEPPRRFDVVQIGIDEVPAPRRRELVERVLREFLVPGGKLVCRAWRDGQNPLGLQLETLGFRPDGEIEAVHPRTGEVRRTAWLRAR